MQEQGDIVAKVSENVLYKEDLRNSIPKELSAEDSVNFAQSLIAKWVEEQVLLERAKYNLGEALPGLEKKVENYKNSLFIYSYERELIRQKLDTIVTNRQIQDYYEQHQQNFQLKDYVLKAKYLKLDAASPKLKQVRKWIQSSSQEDALRMQEYAVQYAISYNLDAEQWLFFNDLLKEVPLRDYNTEDFLKNNSFLEISDDQNIYYISILEYQLKDGVSPLEMVENRIQSIILNNRKLTLAKEIRQKLVEEAKRKNQIEYFE
ncbi:MAG TPA: hypothetical protein DCS15_07530 [Flavobacteriales bacterium]|nr:hypothetical protein [Flavobacteriales bacterium]